MSDPYNTKVNLLKQIDDIASQYGGAAKDQAHLRKSGLRNMVGKSTAQSVLNNGRSLKKHDLDTLSKHNDS